MYNKTSGPNLKNNYRIIFLICLVIAGLIVRLLIIPFDIPVTQDASEYFWYAFDMSVKNSFPDNYDFPNNGWPSFLSVIFDLFNFDRYLDYMNIQKITTVIISLITIISIYHLCTRFFNSNYALIGAAIFAFEPRLIFDSVSGSNLTLFILLFVSSLSFFMSKNPKMIYISFAFASLATLVRYEGLLLVIPLSIIYFKRFGLEKKSSKRFILIILLFILILTPMVYVRYEITGNDGIIYHLTRPLQLVFGLESNIDTSPRNNLIGGELTPYRDFVGNIDEISIWNTELDQENVTSLYNGGIPNTEQIGSLEGLSNYISFNQILLTSTSDNSEFVISGSCLDTMKSNCNAENGFSSTIEITQGIVGNSAYFDGNDTIKFDDFSFPYGDSARSISLWIFPELSDHSSSDWNIQHLYYSGTIFNEKSFEISTNLMGKNTIGVDINGQTIFSDTETITMNEWNHIVVTYAGKKPLNSESVKIFHNGIQLKTNSTTDSNVQESFIWKSESNTFLGLDLFIKFLLWITFPLFFVFIPYGIFSFLKERSDEKLLLLSFCLIMTIPALYAYFRGFPDTKYLFFLFPFFTILSLYSIRKFAEKFTKNRLVILLILSAIISSSIIFTDIKKEDIDSEREAFEIAQILLKKSHGFNEPSHIISKYAESSELFLQSNLDPKSIVKHRSLIPNLNDGIHEFIKKSKNYGLTHLIIDENTNPNFLREIFYDENKYKFLEKEFDSINHGYKYHVKIFKIDYSKFPSL
ncbi:MAG: glycosyltransferase family 39 protein [Candidatus Nitrosopelagicus sp.]|nr:glycosyltransferase family 39 protein [Candidatus Nitrosopelagicus sp.]